LIQDDDRLRMDREVDRFGDVKDDRPRASGQLDFGAVFARWRPGIDTDRHRSALLLVGAHHER
jgi:hypothetical protein